MVAESVVTIPLVVFILSATQTAASVFNDVNCSTQMSFAPNSTFQINLNILLSSLSSNATGNTRFYNATVGGNNSSSDTTVFGFFMCRGDVPLPLCRECVYFATHKVSSSCPFAKEAIIWYNECLLRYSYRNIFTTMEEWPRYQIKIPLGDPGLLNSRGFYSALRSILNHLISEAANALHESNQFAFAQANASGDTTLYGLGQCTPGLSVADCKRCVGDAEAEITTSCCGGSIGQSVQFPSCVVRYETYPFYQHSGTSIPATTVAKRKGRTKTIIIIIVPVVVLAVLSCFTYCFSKTKARKRHAAILRENFGPEVTTWESLQFDLATIQVATNKFSDECKIGKGGFGEVYKGILPNGQEIAAKRLSGSSGQGAQEFKNEILLIARLQHRNLVRLLGFCLEEHEKILIYEYVPNNSLNFFLFDPQKQRQLSWSERYKIIGGIVRGILYLHEDSRLKIIHRDLKPSNILLDNSMNSKISDFGLARMVAMDQTQGSTSRIVGTYGYMSPEYAMHGQFSEKSDVFSFGVMVLEIISGIRNSCSYDSCRVDDLLSNAWKLWRDQSPLELLDSSLRDCYCENQVVKCIQIGLLCVQENPDDRPAMGTIASYLNNVSVELPFPLEPAFFMRGRMRRNINENESYSLHSTKTSYSLSSSVNEMSITHVYSR